MADKILHLKTCSKCGNEFALEFFGRCKGNKDGLRGWCKSCDKSFKAEWYKKNSHKLKEKMAARYAIKRDEDNAKKRLWNAENKELKSARAAVYREKNKDKIAASSAIYRASNAEILKTKKAEAYAKIPRDISRKKARNYYLQHKDNLNALSAEWREQNQHKNRAIQHNYRARKRGAGRASIDIVERLMVLQKGKCACCRVLLDTTVHHLDHIYPLSRGGRNEDGNLQLLCRHCNQRKHAKLPHEFMQENGFLL